MTVDLALYSLINSALNNEYDSFNHELSSSEGVRSAIVARQRLDVTVALA